MTQANSYPVTLTLGLDDKMSKALARSIERANGQMKKAETGWQKFQKAGAADKFGIAGKKLTGIGTAATVGLTAPLAAAGAASVKLAMDFNKSMGNIATLVDTNVESMDAMKASVLDMARRVPVPISDLTESLYDARSAGVAAKDQFVVLEAAAKLGMAGLGTTKESMALITGAMNAFGPAAGTAAQAANTVFATIKSGKTTIAELVQGFGTAAPVISSAGIKLDDYLSSVSAMTSLTTPAATVHTQLKAVISGLMNETEQSKQLFDSYGVKTLPEFIEKAGGLQGAMHAIKKEFKGSNPEIKKLLGSAEALSAVISLTGEQSDEAAASLALMRKESGLLDEAAAKQDKLRAMEKLQNAIEVSAIKIGTRLLPMVERVTDSIVKVIDKYDSLGSTSKSVIDGMVIAFAVGGPLLVGIGAVASAVSSIAGAWKLVTTAADTAKAAQLAAKAIETGTSTAPVATKVASSVLPTVAPTVAASGGGGLLTALGTGAAAGAAAIASAGLAVAGILAYTGYAINESLDGLDIEKAGRDKEEARALELERFQRNEKLGALGAAANAKSTIKTEIALTGVPAGMSASFVPVAGGSTGTVSDRRGPV